MIFPVLEHTPFPPTRLRFVGVEVKIKPARGVAGFATGSPGIASKNAWKSDQRGLSPGQCLHRAPQGALEKQRFAASILPHMDEPDHTADPIMERSPVITIQEIKFACIRRRSGFFLTISVVKYVEMWLNIRIFYG